MSLLLRGPSAFRLSRGGRPHRWRINCRMKGRRPSRRGSICVAMRPAIALAFALLVAACDALPASAPKGPTGPIGDVAHAVADLLGPGTAVTDARFDSFLADIDFAKAFGPRAAEIGDQIKQARSAATKRKSATAVSVGRLASVRVVLGEALTLEFAKTLADSLDEFTKVSGTHEFPPLAPTAHTSDGATA